MSQENVDVVREYFAVVNDGDFPRVMAFYAEDVELIIPADAFLDPGTFSGREAVGRWFGDWFRTFRRGYHFDLDEVRDLGELVFAAVTHGGLGKASGAEVHATMNYLFGIRDGRIARLELFSDRSEALNAAGAPE
jgi:ketosteroid isomerase-like protein